MFKKKKHFSKLFDSEVWIVNLTPHLAIKDEEISRDNLPVWSKAEMGIIKDLNDEVKTACNRIKRVFRGAEVFAGEWDWSGCYRIENGDWRSVTAPTYESLGYSE